MKREFNYCIEYWKFDSSSSKREKEAYDKLKTFYENKDGPLIYQVKMIAESMLADGNRITDVIEKLVDGGSKYEKEYKIIILPYSPIYPNRYKGYQMQNINEFGILLVLEITISQECKMQ